MRRTTPRPLRGLERLESRTTPALIAVGSQAGSEPNVKLVDSSGTVVRSFLAYDPAFRGGVRTAYGDVTGDGVPDVVTAPGAGGGPQVNVYNGQTGALESSFFAYDPAFRGGVNVAVGTVDGRGVIVTGAGAGGGPQVNVYDGATGMLDRSFFAYDPSFLGGVTVAVGNVLGTGDGSVVTAAGPGGGPQVNVYDGTSGGLQQSFFAYDPSFHGGVTVATGDVLGLGRDQIVTGPGSGGGPQVNVYDATAGAVVQSFFAYAPSFTGGVGVTVVPDGGGDGRDLIVTAAGPGGGPDVRVFDAAQLANGQAADGAAAQPVVVNNFFAYPPYYNYGLGFGAGFGLYLPYYSGLGFGPGFGGYSPYFTYASPAGFVGTSPYAGFAGGPDDILVDPSGLGTADPTSLGNVVTPDPLYSDPGDDGGGFGDGGSGGYDDGYFGDSGGGYFDGFGDDGGFDDGGDFGDGDF